MTNDHVAVFYAAHVLLRDPDLNVSQGAQPATVPARQRYCLAPDGIGMLYRVKDVR